MSVPGPAGLGPRRGRRGVREAPVRVGPTLDPGGPGKDKRVEERRSGVCWWLHWVVMMRTVVAVHWH